MARVLLAAILEAFVVTAALAVVVTLAVLAGRAWWRWAVEAGRWADEHDAGPLDPRP